MLFYFDYLSFAEYAYIIYGCVLFFLILLLGLGGAVKGSQRWFSVGSFAIQPSEFMKITLVLALARFLRYKKYGLGLFDIGISILLTCVPMLLIMKQPDLGTALVMVPILISILYAAGIRLYQLLMLVGTGLAISPLLWMFVLKSYQKMRIIGFLWPDKATDWGSGYHRLQPFAIGSGGLFGQDKYTESGNLPERHTDLLCVIAEEGLRLVLFPHISSSLCGIGLQEARGTLRASCCNCHYVCNSNMVNIGIPGNSAYRGITSFFHEGFHGYVLSPSIIFNIKILKLIFFMWYSSKFMLETFNII